MLISTYHIAQQQATLSTNIQDVRAVTWLRNTRTQLTGACAARSADRQT